MEKQISNGIDPRVFYFRAKERGLPEVKSDYVDIRLNYSNWHRPFFYLKESTVLKDFFELYQKSQFDLIHAHTLFSNGYIAMKAKDKWGIPYIVAVRNVDINVFFKYRLNLRKLGIEILKQAEKIIFLSSSYKDFTISKFIPEDLKAPFLDKTVVLPNGIDPYFLENKGSYAPSPINKKKLLNIITVGHVCKNKNQITVCKAVEKLNKLGIKTIYTVIGGVPEKSALKRILKYPFVNYIPFLSKEELITEFRKADIYVMPSLTETFGLTYAEAMSQGKPVIYTKGQGFDGQFREGEVGYSVHYNSYKEISSKIEDILKEYEELSKRCIDRVEKFNWEEIVQKYLQIYGDL
ncbi:glycosyltransferase family 4 protein [Lentibacillus sp. N15]